MVEISSIFKGATLYEKLGEVLSGNEALNKEQSTQQWSKWAASAQQGDSEAYEKLLIAISPEIHRFASLKTGHLASADDITQEVLVAIHSSLQTYSPGQSFKNWMLAIARYKIIDHLRERQRKWGKNVEFEEKLVTIDDSDAKEEGGELEMAVENAVNDLPDEMKRAVSLTKLQGLSTEQAAEVEGISSAALRTRISRAYQILRKRLESEFG